MIYTKDRHLYVNKSLLSVINNDVEPPWCCRTSLKEVITYKIFDSFINNTNTNRELFVVSDSLQTSCDDSLSVTGDSALFAILTNTLSIRTW